MKLLAIDGNSIMNRAFYGIKLLSNSKGQFTNALTGFMNIYLTAWQWLSTLKPLLSDTRRMPHTKPTERVCLRSLLSKCL